MPMIALAIMAVSTVVFMFWQDAKASGYLKSESKHLARISQNANQTIEDLRRNTMVTNKLVHEYRNDIDERKEKEIALLKRIERMETPDGEKYCRAGCIDLIPVD